jgi:hypothetical protein
MHMNLKNTLSQTATELGLLLENVKEAALMPPRPLGFIYAMDDAGIDIGSAVVDDNELLSILDGIVTAYESVAAIVSEGIPELHELPGLIQANEGMLDAIDALKTISPGPDAVVQAAELPRLVLDHFLLAHLRRRYPTLYSLLVLFGREGTYLFGPMVKIGWGPVPILLAELGIAFEFPDPLRLLLFGQLHLGLPSLDKPIMDAHMDLFGTLHFEAGTLAVDASLVDSTIAGHRLEGDAALRVRWKEDPDFALAIGGFHPRAVPPAGFPALRRVGLQLSKTDNPRVWIEGYFALTSNTVQCGARVDAYARKGKFSAEAFLSFDTLFRFEPFRFIAEMAAGAAIKAYGKTITTVDLELLLSGPKPWHAVGKVSFKAIWRYTIHFDMTVGDRPSSVPVAPADLRALLLEELHRPTSWTGQLPPPGGTAVTLRDARSETGDTLLVHPQGRFGVRQTVLPLDTPFPLDKYGEKPPLDDKRFLIRRVRVDGQDVARVAVRDRFAPAQYFTLTEAQRLTAPAYESFDAGVAVEPDNTRIGDRVTVQPQYEEVIVDAARGHRQVSAERVGLPSGALGRVHERSAQVRGVRMRHHNTAFPGERKRIRLVA